MKRTLLFIACMLASVSMHAQEGSNDYRPLIEEGKHWTYYQNKHYYYYDLKGDTLIAGKNSLKMYSNNEYNDSIIRYEGALYEEDKKVYCFYPGKTEAELLYDFDRKVGEKFNVKGYQMLVKDILTENDGGIAIKKYILQIVWDYAEDYVIWIEGVGATIDFFHMIPAVGNNCSLRACEVNGEKLYQWIVPDHTDEGYHKMGIEGKRWNYIHYYLDKDGEHNEPYSYIVRGDTIIKDTVFNKLWYQDEKTEKLVCLIRERGRKVIKRSIDESDNSSETSLMTSFFAFGREDFDRVYTWKSENDSGNTNWMVYGVDTIEVNSKLFRRYTCLQKYSEEGVKLSTIEYDGEGVWHDIWVEGVGSASSGIEDQHPYHEPPVTTTNDYTYFVSCYENGECIFTTDDFRKPAYTPDALPQDDYIPFVELDKKWNVVRSDVNPNYSCSIENYEMYKEVEHDGKTYIKTYLNDDILCTSKEVGLFREENRRVYKYDEKAGTETMLYDFSLKEGDIFTYEDFNPSVKCKVLKLGWLEDGPKIALPGSNPASTLDFSYRRLRKWTIGVDNGAGEYDELITWVEGVGALENTFAPFYTGGGRCILAYVERKDAETDYNLNNYLPFSFYNIRDVYCHFHGCDLATGKEVNSDNHRLTYEMEGDRLHVYGNVPIQCGPNNYAYFYERPTNDPKLHKVELFIQEVEPTKDCWTLRTTDFYVPGFDPNLNYIVVDYAGEHIVINQEQYRPFVEEGKVWAIKVISPETSEEWMDFYYLEGDTIVNGQKAKRMLYDRIGSGQDIIGEYVGACYEQDKKVYYSSYNGGIQFDYEQLYDFTLATGDFIQDPDGNMLIVMKVSRSIPGFKGTYFDFLNVNVVIERWLEGVGSESWPWCNHPRWHNGNIGVLLTCSVGDEVIYYNSEADDPFVMNARKRFDFTHTTKEKPKMPMRRDAEQSLYGEYNDKLLGINLDPLDEAYLVRIVSETGKAVYEKAINAGNIVGLNIDISSYPKGRYTVTVENSWETFTGEFDAQTTGIRDALRLNNYEGIKNNIYNLQGQRLSTLQRGLNIVNGKKVYVK